jgi:hypothetical protein
MATFKAVVYADNKKKDGTYNVKIRITHKRQTRKLSTNTFVSSVDITKNLNIKNQNIKDNLKDLIDKYYGYVSDVGCIADAMTVDEIVKYIKERTENEYTGKNRSVSFFGYADKMIGRMCSEGRRSTAGNYRIMLNSLNKFAGDKITFSDINVTFLNKYEEFLRSGKTGPRGLSLYMGLIRAVFNEAIRELNDYEQDKILIKGNPFTKYKIKAEPPTEKRSIPIDKICGICRLPDTELKRENFARDLFMLSFYLIGMNTVDLYNCDSYKDGRITYNRKKTSTRRDDKALFSVKVPEIAIPLIEKYKDHTHVRVFNFYRMYADRSTFNAAINKGLKIIGKRIGIDGLEHYAARHSWATIARNDLRIDKYVVHESLNHVDEKTKVTDIYTQKDWSIVDDANKAVINYFILMFILSEISFLLTNNRPNP